MENELLTIGQVMELLKVSDDTIYRHIKNGKLKAVRVGGMWRISQKALEVFLNNGQGK